jgi:predicted SAM-dependent methyltransferase
MLYKKPIRLDVGCGKNKKEGFIGIDIDKNSDADIIASALDVPFEDETVDEIFSAHLVEHFSPREAEKFFAEVFRLLKKGSKAFIAVDVEWTKKRLLKKDPTHKHRFSVQELKKIINQFNFLQIKVERKIYRVGFKPRNKIFIELVK